MPQLVEFLPKSASSEEWSRYHAYRRLWQQERRPDDPLPPDDVTEIRMKRSDPFQRHHLYCLVQGDEMVGELSAEAPTQESPEYESNRHILWSWGHVLEPYRRRGIGRSCLPTVLALMDQHGATVLSTMAEDEPGDAFVRRLGAEPKLVERTSRLDLRQVDWAMVSEWVAAGEAASPGARLDRYPNAVPDEQLPEYCVAMTELLNTMPFEGLDHGDIVMTVEGERRSRERKEAIGSVNPTFVVRDAEGSIAGMTDMVKHAYEPGIVRQNFTGVHPRARGRGIGRWLKAAMLEHLRTEYPDTIWVETENAASNRPMLAINHALGFRLHRTIRYYQTDRETLSRAI
jgi:mycothiol synthase